MRKIRIGLVGLFHRNARGDHEAFERAKKELGILAVQKQFELYVASEIVYGYEDGKRMVSELNEQNLDFVFMLSASVIIGNAVIPFGHLRSKIGVWALPECRLTGMLPMNAFCGTMIFSGMLGKYLKEYHIKFKWFYGYVDNPLFIERFDVTLKALRADVALRETKIASIGPVVDGFDYMVVNEADIERLYGAHIDRLHSVEEIVTKALKFSSKVLEEEVKKINEEGMRTKFVSNESMEKFARLYLAFREFARENGFNVLSISCWRTLQEIYGMVPCGAISRLNNNGIIASCEGDVDGAIGMVVDTAMNEAPASMVDLVSIDDADQSMNIWHCGPAPGCMADHQGIRWDQHFNMGHWEGSEWCGCGVIADLQFKPGEITVHRLCSTTQELVVFKAEVFDKESYQGSSGWIHNFKMQGKQMNIPELLSLLYNYRVDHHMSFGYGDIEDALIEFANWKEIKVGEYSPYVPYMELRK